MSHTFRIDLKVHDPEQLHAAAKAHEDGADLSLRNEDGSVDIEACLITLLDPGDLAGCNIHNSQADAWDKDTLETWGEDT